jgi:hypothetical protein
VNIRHPEWPLIDPARAELVRQIESHPRFPKLVREAAVAEQAGAPRASWLRRNSATFGTWINRCTAERYPRQGRLADRTWALAEQIRPDIGFDGWADREATAMVFVTALEHVRARSNGRQTQEA